MPSSSPAASAMRSPSSEPERVVDINALRVLAPPRVRPVPRSSRPQPRTPPPPLEPQAQRTLASGRADRARPAVSGMLGAHTAAVKRQMTRRITGNDASRCRHDGGAAALEDEIRARRRETRAARSRDSALTGPSLPRESWAHVPRGRTLRPPGRAGTPRSAQRHASQTSRQRIACHLFMGSSSSWRPVA
jgi:hypothetical protein